MPGKTDVLYVLALFALIALLYLPQLLSGKSAVDAPHRIDITTQWYPAYTLVGNSYRDGLFPLWNPHRYCGMPWLAYTHTGGLYPANILLFSALDFFDAVTVAHMLHAMIAGFFLFALARRLGLSQPAAFMAAAVFNFSGFYFFIQSQLSNHATISWSMLLFYALVRLHGRPRVIPFILLAAATAMMVLAGDTEGLVYSLIFFLLFILLFLGREKKGSTLRTLLLSGCGLATGIFMGAAVILVLLELMPHSVRSPQSLFQLGFTGFLKPVQNYWPFIFFPWSNFNEIHPNSDFNNGLPPFYLGGLALIGTLYSIGLYRRDPRVRALWHVALIIFAYFFARQIYFLDPFLERIPLLGQMATPERALEQVQLAQLLAAGMAFDYFRESNSGRSTRFFSGIIAAWGVAILVLAPRLLGDATQYTLAAVLVFTGLFGLLARVEREDRLRLVTWAAVFIVIADVYMLSLVSVPRTDPDSFELDPAVSGFIEDRGPGFRFIAFENIGPEAKSPDLSGLVSARKGLDTPFGHMRLPLHRYFEFMHIIDSGVAKDWKEIFYKAPADKKVFYTVDLYNPAFLSDSNIPLLDMLSVKYIFSNGISFKFSSPFCLMNEGGLPEGDWLSYPRENSTTATFIRDRGRRALETELPYMGEFALYVHPGSELSFQVKRGAGEPLPWKATVRLLAGEADSTETRKILDRTIESVSEQSEEFSFSVSLEEFADTYTGFRLEILPARPGTRAWILDAKIIRPDMPFQRIGSGQVDIFVNEKALPGAFVVHEAMSAHPEEMRKILPDPARFDPRRTILLEKGMAPESLISFVNDRPGSFPGKEPVRVVKWGSQEIKIEARLLSPGWLFLSDAHYPGWRVWVDGRESVVYRANYIFRAVYLSGAEHTVEFIYHPVSFRVGIWFGITSAAVWLLTAAFSVRRGGRK